MRPWCQGGLVALGAVGLWSREGRCEGRAVAVCSGKSGAGAASTRWLAELERGMPPGWQLQAAHTGYAGHAALLAEQACRGGADAVVAIGGDGTVSEVISGMVAAGESDTVLAVCPAGTWNILAAACQLPPPAELCPLLQARQTRRLPLFRVRWESGGERHTRWAFLGVDFGVGPAVVAAVERQKQSWLGRRLPSMAWQHLLGPYYLATAAQHPVAPGPASLSIEGQSKLQLQADAVPMLWVHARSPWDGRLDRLHASWCQSDQLPWLPRLLAFFALRQIYNGMSQICRENQPVSAVAVHAEQEFDFLIDGELCRASSVWVSVCDDQSVQLLAPDS